MYLPAEFSVALLVIVSLGITRSGHFKATSVLVQCLTTSSSFSSLNTLRSHTNYRTSTCVIRIMVWLSFELLSCLS